MGSNSGAVAADQSAANEPSILAGLAPPQNQAPDANALFQKLLSNVLQFGQDMVNPGQPSTDDNGQAPDTKAKKGITNAATPKVKSLADIGNNNVTRGIYQQGQLIQGPFNAPLPGEVRGSNSLSGISNGVSNLTSVFDKLGSKMFGTPASGPTDPTLTDTGEGLSATSEAAGGISQVLSEGAQGVLAAIAALF